MRRIYLDHHVAAPVLPEVVDAMAPYWREQVASPSGIHSGAKIVREVIDAARARVLDLIGAPDEGSEVVFTGSGTEAVNLGVLGYARAHRRFGSHIVCSAVEHPAVLNAIGSLEASGFSASRAPVNRFGEFSFDSIAELVGEKTILLCCQLANADVGTIQSLERIGVLAQEKAIGLFVDARAAGGRMPIDVLKFNADLLALSPNAFGGPLGVGALYKKSRVDLLPIYFGGEQENGLRPGAENVPGIVGSGMAAALATERGAARWEAMSRLQARLLVELRTRIDGVQLNGREPGAGRLCHQLSLTLGGVEAEGLVLFADMRGLSIASGGGCLSRSLDVHYVLSALGLSAVEGKQTISLGVGLETVEREIDEAVGILDAGAARLRSLSPSWSG